MWRSVLWFSWDGFRTWVGLDLERLFQPCDSMWTFPHAQYEKLTCEFYHCVCVISLVGICIRKQLAVAPEIPVNYVNELCGKWIMFFSKNCYMSWFQLYLELKRKHKKTSNPKPAKYPYIYVTRCFSLKVHKILGFFYFASQWENSF